MLIKNKKYKKIKNYLKCKQIYHKLIKFRYKVYNL